MVRGRKRKEMEIPAGGRGERLLPTTVIRMGTYPGMKGPAGFSEGSGIP
jgi:hypothetical protein